MTKKNKIRKIITKLSQLKGIQNKQLKQINLPKFKRATFHIPGKYTRNLFLGGDN
jgi:hypothetical protein